MRAFTRNCAAAGLLWLASALPVSAQVFTNLVDASGRLFALGRPAEAARVLERWMATNPPTANVLFDLGQARLQAGEPGRAIAAWRQARELAPRDRGIAAALEQARQRVGTADAHPLAAMTGWLRDEEWAVAALVCTGGFGVVLLVSRLRPGKWGGWVVPLGLIQLLAVTGWGTARAARELSPNAVVIQREVTASQAPVPEARALRPLAEGAEVRVLRVHGEWSEVALGGVRAGWVPTVALAVD